METTDLLKVIATLWEQYLSHLKKPKVYNMKK